MREEALARSLSEHDVKGFWKQIQRQNNAKTPLPSSIDGCVGEEAIANMWRSHFEDVMNSVPSETHRDAVEEALQGELLASNPVLFAPVDIEKALNKVNRGKACGLDGIAAEHFIHAHAPNDLCSSVYSFQLLYIPCLSPQIFHALDNCTDCKEQSG